jgi:hypothetical protein
MEIYNAAGNSLDTSIISSKVISPSTVKVKEKLESLSTKETISSAQEDQ